MCLACETKVTAESLDEFSTRYLEILNHGALCLMISVGHRTGLFQALRSIGPCTSEQLARASHLNERYVREWLGAMTAGRLVAIEGNQFVLPERYPNSSPMRRKPATSPIFAIYRYARKSRPASSSASRKAAAFPTARIPVFTT